MTPNVSMSWLRNNPNGVWERFQAFRKDFQGVVLLFLTHNCTSLNYCYCNYSN